jgi:hypothetical protein
MWPFFSILAPVYQSGGITTRLGLWQNLRPAELIAETSV